MHDVYAHVGTKGTANLGNECAMESVSNRVWNQLGSLPLDKVRTLFQLSSCCQGAGLLKIDLRGESSQ